MKRKLARRFRHSRRTIGRVRAACLVLLCLISWIGVSFIRCRPIMTDFAQSQAVRTATKIANETAAQVLLEFADLCANTIAVTYDDQQKVSSVKTDVSAVNTVRTAMTERAVTEMEQFTSLSVTLPLGTLSGWRWFSGLGPLLSFPMSFTAVVLSDVSSSLVAEGINQSSYRVLIHLMIELYVVSPAGRTTVSTRVSYPMAESVIMGEVPDNLTEVYGDDQSLLGKIFDYGTTQ